MEPGRSEGAAGLRLGPQDDARSIAAIHEAVRRGVNWIDTAGIHGLGHSEEMVGRALREIPPAERPLIFTKGGLVADPTRPYDEPQRNLRPASIRREVEASLSRPGVERVDLYQFHWADAIGTPIEESWGEMARLVEDPGGRRLQLRRRSPRTCRGDPPCGLAPAPLLADPA